MNIRNIKSTLNKILQKGFMSPMLREAVTATIEALSKENYALAYQITACKSYVIGKINSKNTVYAFQEDEAANNKILGRSLYSILDGIHHEIAFAIDKMPSGMMVLSANGSIEMQHKGTHPIVKRIITEDKHLYSK
jgi:hypothetical protein